MGLASKGVVAAGELQGEPFYFVLIEHLAGMAIDQVRLDLNTCFKNMTERTLSTLQHT